MLIKPFKDEIVEAGVKELLTPADVDAALKKPGLTLVFVNSVCGCAAGMARPALRKFMEAQDAKNPVQVVTVFAGQDLEATARLRNHIPDIPPSSPCFAFFKDGELINFIPKYRIEMRNADAVANDIQSTFTEFA
jgi:putative YphP/YqiW family bacilliredoxin